MPVADYVTAAIDSGRARQETVVVEGIGKTVWDEFEEPRAQRVEPQWELYAKLLGKAYRLD